MAGEYLKTPLVQALPPAIRKQIANEMQRNGKSLPVSVVANPSSGVVTVRFEVESKFTLPKVTVPVAMSEFVRFPVPNGTKGVVMAADAYLGGVSGLGGGVANLAQPANLSALVFFPLGNTAWESVDLARTVIYGPEGVEIRDAVSGDVLVEVTATGVTATDGTSTLTLAGGDATLTNGSATIALSGPDINLTGTLIINGHAYTDHTHGGVTAGAAFTSDVTP